MNLLIRCYQGAFEKRIQLIRSHQDEFKKRILEVITFINDVDLIKSKNKNVIHNAVIISIYGIFENFIDDVLSEYVNILLSSNMINDKLKSKYINTSAEFLQNPNRFKNMDLNTEKVIDGLDAINKKDNFDKIITKFIIKHSANLKLEQINELAKDLGVENFETKLVSFGIDNVEVQTYMNNYDNNDYDSLDEGRKKEVFLKKLENIINDVVEKRNMIAHSWHEDELISIELIKTEYIDMFICIVDLMCEILIGELISNLNSDRKLLKLNYDKKLDKIFNNSILCIHNINENINNKTLIFVQKQGEKWYQTKIESIQINNIDVEKADTGSSVGIKLDTKIKDSNKFYILK